MPSKYKRRWVEHDHAFAFPGCELTPEQIEFGKAMERWQRENGTRWPHWSDVLTVAKQLGYKRD